MSGDGPVLNGAAAMGDAKDHPLKKIIAARKAVELAKAEEQRTEEPKPGLSGSAAKWPDARQALKDEIVEANKVFSSAGIAYKYEFQELPPRGADCVAKGTLQLISRAWGTLLLCTIEAPNSGGILCSCGGIVRNLVSETLGLEATREAWRRLLTKYYEMVG